MFQARHVCIVAIVAAIVALVSGQISGQTGKEELKSKAALDALEKYGKAYETINKEFKLRHQELLKALIADLNPARADAIGAGDLDEAMAILMKVKEAEKLAEQDQVVAVKVPEPGSKLTIKELSGKRFQFIAINVEPAQIVLGSTGKLLEYNTANESGWIIDKNGRLCLTTQNGRTSSVFDKFERSQSGRLIFDGQFLLNKGVRVYLREVSTK